MLEAGFISSELSRFRSTLQGNPNGTVVTTLPTIALLTASNLVVRAFCISLQVVTRQLILTTTKFPFMNWTRKACAVSEATTPIFPLSTDLPNHQPLRMSLNLGVTCFAAHDTKPASWDLIKRHKPVSLCQAPTLLCRNYYWHDSSPPVSRWVSRFPSSNHISLHAARSILSARVYLHQIEV